MPVRRRRTLFLENEMTGLSVAHVGSTCSNQGRDSDKLLGRIRPSPRWGAAEHPAASKAGHPACPVAPPPATATHPSLPGSPAWRCCSKPKSSEQEPAGLRHRRGDTAKTTGGAARSSPGRHTASTPRSGEPSRRGCAAGDGSTADLLGLPGFLLLKCSDLP